MKKHEIKKYRLGNQSGEYELREDYLGWIPEYYENWDDLVLKFIKNVTVSIFNPVPVILISENNKSKQAKKTLFLHHFIIKDAFPMSFYGEERSKEWNHFAIVSETVTSEKFIIPLN